jgi:curved DNA-binding protein CbpA
MLKQKPELPPCFQVLGFVKIPENKDQIKARYRQLAKTAHPDRGGSFTDFVRLRRAFENSIKFLEQKERGGSND